MTNFHFLCDKNIIHKVKTSLFTVAAFLSAGLPAAAAAENPFTDVPESHWAYDSIARLVKDGVIEGYGDSTYLGERVLTRYEMAQIVARAMAVKNIHYADKIEVTKLSAEFADELNSLGARVSNLEKKVSNLKYSGKFIYTYQTSRLASLPEHDNNNELRLKLDLNTEINNNWQGKAQFSFPLDMDSAKNVTDMDINRLFVEGNYNNWQIKAGKFDYSTEADNGMIFDDDISGVQLEYGKDIKVKLMSGRFEYDVSEYKYRFADKLNNSNIDITGLEVYSNSHRFTWGAGWHRVKSRNLLEVLVNGNRESYDIISIGGSYQLTPELVFKAAFAKASNISEMVTTASRTAYNAELFYRGADENVPGSWGAWIAYRQLGNAPCVATTYESIRADEKGINVGVEVTLAKNMLGYLEYFDGSLVGDDIFNEQKITAGTRGKNIFARVTVMF